MSDGDLKLALRDRDNTRLRIQLGGTAVILFISAFPIAAMYPIAKAFAGKQTALTLSVSIVVSISLLGVAAVLGAALKWQRRRYKHARKRVDRLRAIAGYLVDRLTEAGLDDKIPAGVQRELDS